jgi:hypothetical protein
LKGHVLLWLGLVAAVGRLGFMLLLFWLGLFFELTFGLLLTSYFVKIVDFLLDFSVVFNFSGFIFDVHCVLVGTSIIYSVIKGALTSALAHCQMCLHLSCRITVVLNKHVLLLACHGVN